MKKIAMTYEKALALPWSHQIVQRSTPELPFLHDTMVASLGGRLFEAWYACAENEMIGRTVIRGRWSSDGGKSWSEPETVAENKEGYLMVPVTFSEKDGEIWAYVTRMTAPDHPIGYDLFRYEEGAWVKRGEKPDPVIFNTLPVKSDGRWLLGGRTAEVPNILPQYPVIALSTPSSPAEWEIRRLPMEEKLHCPETTLAVSGARVTAFTRNDGGDIYVFESEDGGLTWSKPYQPSLPIHPAKMCAGSLGDERQYLIYNERTEKRDRSRLVMALRNGPDEPFDRAYIVAEGYDDSLDGGPYWHYPSVAMQNGVVYVSSTSSGDGVERHAALHSISLQKLK